MIMIEISISPSDGARKQFFHILFKETGIEVTGKSLEAAASFDGQVWRLKGLPLVEDYEHATARVFATVVCPSSLQRDLEVLWGRWREGRLTEAAVREKLENLEPVLTAITKTYRTWC
jgi:hypothetical protein